MAPYLFPVLFSCSGLGAAHLQEQNLQSSQVLAVITALMAYVSLRRWSGTGLLGIGTVVCLLILVVHPAWTVGYGGDCAQQRFLMSVLATVFAGAFAFADHPPATLRATHFGWHLGPASKGAAAGSGIAARLLAGFDRRLPALSLVGFFAYGQYEWYRQESQLPHWSYRSRALGPLYFLANASPTDDWIGFALLAVAVPCLLGVVIWPARWTAAVAIVTALAWVVPGLVETMTTPWEVPLSMLGRPRSGDTR
jgi:hypothetical protein